MKILKMKKQKNPCLKILQMKRNPNLISKRSIKKETTKKKNQKENSEFWEVKKNLLNSLI